MRGTAVRLPTGLLRDATLGLFVLGLSLAARSVRGTGITWPEVGVTLLACVAAGLSLRRPSWALGVIWTAAVLQILNGTVVIGVELAVLVVAFGTARCGGFVTVWAAGLSIPLGAALAVGYAVYQPAAFAEAAVAAELLRSSGLGITAGFFVVAAVPGVPFALGLLLRLDERNRRVSTERDAARDLAAAEHELAAARARQTGLARDVHDIVGHSLAVIIAQADAAQLAVSEPPVREALAQISAVGRTSLAEVRDVLSRTEDVAGVGPERVEHDLYELIEGVRAAGSVVRQVSVGRRFELSTGSAATAYRVLQELLTNCLKHGVAGEPIEVELTWHDGGLTVRVANPIAGHAPRTHGGMGLSGARGRLEALGGTLHTTRTPDGSFVAVAELPVPAPVRS